MNFPFRFRFTVTATVLLTLLVGPIFSQETPPAPKGPNPPPAVEPAATAADAAAAQTPPAAPGEEPKKDDRSGLRSLDQGTPLEVEQPRRTRQRTSNRGSDQFPIGDHTVPRGRRTHEVISFLGSTLIEGEVDRDVVSMGGRTTIAPGASVGGAAVAVMGRLDAQGRVHQDTVSVMGSSNINGYVGGDAVSVLGNMHLGPKAVVDGDLVVVGGTLTKDPEAVVHGDQVHVPFVTGFTDMDWLVTWVKRCVFLGRPLAFSSEIKWAWVVAVSLFGFYLLLSLLFPRGIVRCVETLENRPGMSVASSLLSVLLTPVAIVLLSITVVGALLVPFLGAGLVFAKLFGKAVMLAWLGRRFTSFFGNGPLGHPVFAVLVGGLLVLLLYTVPVFGFLTFALLTWLGFGVVMLTIAQSMKRDRLPPAQPSAPGAASVPPVPEVSGAVAAAPLRASFEASPDMTPPPARTSPTFSGITETAPALPDLPPIAPPPVVPSFPEMSNPATPAPEPAPLPPPTALPPRPAGPVGTLPATVAVTWPRAGFFMRLAAMILDGVLIGILMTFLYHMLPRFLRSNLNDSPGPWLIALALYAAVMWKNKGTTIGGIVCGLKVVRVDNRELDWTTAIVRALGCFLSVAVAGLGFIWVAIDDDKQSWHDKIAGTTVVRVPKGVSLI